MIRFHSRDHKRPQFTVPESCHHTPQQRVSTVNSQQLIDCLEAPDIKIKYGILIILSAILQNSADTVNKSVTVIATRQRILPKYCGNIFQ